MGGVAVSLHGYRRNTTNIDVLLRQEDFGLAAHDLQDGIGSFRSYRKIRYLFANECAGKDSKVKLPDPSDAKATTEIEELPVVTLTKLIEAKIACGLGSMRRTHKDFADVVELIAQNRLTSSFARFLHKSLRVTYRELVKQSKSE
jgi:hypothetical protein